MRGQEAAVCKRGQGVAGFAQGDLHSAGEGFWGGVAGVAVFGDLARYLWIYAAYEGVFGKAHG